MDDELTLFQRECERRLTEVLRSNAKELVERRIAGTRERYILARLSNTPFEVYIYYDEAQIQGAIDERFEKPGYRSPNDLIGAFVSRVGELIAG